MTILGKKQMSEEDIKLNYITPVILDGWKSHVTMETKITDGRINISCPDGSFFLDDFFDEWRSGTLYFKNVANGTAPADCTTTIYSVNGAVCSHRFFVDIHFIFWRLLGI